MHDKLTHFAALIPVVEFSDANVMKKYKVNPDPETLDIANTAAKQKEVGCNLVLLIIQLIILIELYFNDVLAQLNNEVVFCDLVIWSRLRW